MSLNSLFDGAISQMMQDRVRDEEVRLREEARIKAENDRKMREEAVLRTLKVSTEYLNAVCGFTQAQSEPSVQGFSDAVTGLMSLGELCGKDEMDLIQLAVITRPELVHHSVLRQYFRKTQDVEVGQLFFNRFMVIPVTTEPLGYDHPAVVAAKQVIGIAAENYGVEKKEMMKNFALLILSRFPGMPVSEHEGFKALLLAVSRTGILKEESPKIPSYVAKSNGSHVTVKPSAGSKMPNNKHVSNMAAAQRVQTMVLPGVTASLKDFLSNNATERAKTAKKGKNKNAA